VRIVAHFRRELWRLRPGIGSESGNFDVSKFYRASARDERRRVRSIDVARPSRDRDSGDPSPIAGLD
jgi:hypothetical protein